jgi:hypothetical protein
MQHAADLLPVPFPPGATAPFNPRAAHRRMTNTRYGRRKRLKLDELVTRPFESAKRHQPSPTLLEGALHPQ